MKRQTVVLIWAAALLLLVVTCCAIFFSIGGFTRTEAMEAFSCTSSKIEEYTVSDKTGGYTLEKGDDGWYLENDKKARLNQLMVEKMVAAVSKITASGTISRKDLEKFDMSNPRTVKLEIDDNEDVEIQFLGTSQNLCAFRISGDRKTYVLYESAREILAPSLDSLRITGVFPNLTDTDTLPDYYKYTDYDGNVTEIRTKTSAELARGKNNRYMMIKPYKREVDDDLFEQQIALKIPVILAHSFVKSPSADKTSYGLDEGARAELSFRWDGKKETLYMGKSENGLVFAMKDGKEDVFLIEAALLEFLQTEPFFILDSGILKNMAEKITGVRIEKGDTVYNITSSKTGSGLRQYFINGKTASSYVFNEILEDLGDMSFKNEIDKEPQNTRDIEIFVYYENDETQMISLVKTGEKSYAVFLNGKAEFEVDSEYVDDLMEELKDAINNPMRMD